MKRLVKLLVRLVLPLGMVLALNRALRTLADWGHRLQLWLQWRSGRRTPGSFDHFINQYCWHSTRDPSAWERGILGLVGMKPDCRVLDLCCGDGFYAYHFYSSRASKVVSADYDAESIRQAQHNFRAPNIKYVCADIRTAMPEGTFDNVAWDAGLDFFSLQDVALLLDMIRQRLAPGGLLSGCVPRMEQGQSGHVDQRASFSGPQDLGAVLHRAFANVAVIELAGPFGSRSTLYFYASDAALPLDPGKFLRLSR